MEQFSEEEEEIRTLLNNRKQKMKELKIMSDSLSIRNTNLPLSDRKYAVTAA